jgi:hypothetical protein
MGKPSRLFASRRFLGSAQTEANETGPVVGSIVAGQETRVKKRR